MTGVSTLRMKSFLLRIVAVRTFVRARQHYLPAIAITLAVGVAVVFADRQKNSLEEEYLRSYVTRQLSVLRSNLEGKIRGDVKLVQGFVATLSSEPDMSQERFDDLARRTFEDDSQLRNLALAPGLVVTRVFPLKGNEKSLGLDYNRNAAQRAAAMLVRDTGKMVLTGPVDLVQGGRGLIARYPVYEDEADGNRRFWGIASAVIDLDKLLERSGVTRPGLPIAVAIVNQSSSGVLQKVFLGDIAVLSNDPIRMSIDLGHEKWMMAATPRTGWEQQAGTQWAFRSLLAVLAALVVAPLYWAGYLMKERQKHIAALQDREDKLEALSQRLELALDASKVGVWEFDVASGSLYWDIRMRHLYGVSPDKAVCDYEDWRAALHTDDLPEAERVFAAAIDGNSEYRTGFRVVAPDGSIRHIRAHGMTYRTPSGSKRIIGANWDITADIELQEELRQAKQRTEMQNRELENARRAMEHNSLHDALTGLPNRRYLDQKLADAEERDTPLALLHIDLDRFKEINDTLGHAAGDEILKRSATVLRSTIADGDFIARIGGDEFVLLSTEARTSADFVTLAERLVRMVSEPIVLDGHECRIGASVGVAMRASTDETPKQLLVNADLALYEAKRRGRNRVEYFNDALRLNSIQTKRTSDEILRGIERGEFVAHYQPQFDATTLEIVGVEALARWEHPDRGLLAPDAFLSIADSLNVVPAIDEAVLDQALFQYTRWQANDLRIPKVSVNVSCQRLRDERLIAKLKALQIQPGSVSFELLESISFDSADDGLRSAIDDIKALGIEIEIDDFGTGYASIVSLLELSPRRLKIDRRLVMPILGSPSQQQLVRSIIEIGRARNIEIVAEGVETMAHARMLRDLGCHTLQGYDFARPMSAETLLGFVRERAWMQAPRRDTA